MADSNSFITVGKLGRPHGIRGDLRLWIYNPNSTLVDGASSFEIISERGERRTLTLSKARRGKDNRSMIIATEEINNRTDAEALNGWEVLWPTDSLPTLDEGEFYYYKVEGCEVVTESGQPVGTVKQLIETSHPVMVITCKGRSELLLPVLETVVLKMDFENNRVVVADDAPDMFA